MLLSFLNMPFLRALEMNIRTVNRVERSRGAAAARLKITCVTTLKERFGR